MPGISSECRWTHPDAVFARKRGAKRPAAAERLVTDQGALLAPLDLPASRTVNPVESALASSATGPPGQGRPVARTARLTVLKRVTAASKTWRRLKCENGLPALVPGVATRAPDHRAVTEVRP
jgi:hypothetical protein